MYWSTVTSLLLLCSLASASVDKVCRPNQPCQIDEKRYLSSFRWSIQLTSDADVPSLGIDDEGDNQVLLKCRKGEDDIVRRKIDESEQGYTLISPNHTTTIEGSSLYVDGKKYCSWSLIPSDPFIENFYDVVDSYILNTTYTDYVVSVTLNYTVKAFLPLNEADLPNDLAAELASGNYKIYGNEMVALLTRLNGKNIDFILYMNKSEPLQTQVELISYNIYNVVIECDFPANEVIKFLEVSNEVIHREQLSPRIYGKACYWSLPNEVQFGDFGFIDIQEIDRQLVFLVKGVSVYTNSAFSPIV